MNGFLTKKDFYFLWLPSRYVEARKVNSCQKKTYYPLLRVFFRTNWIKFDTDKGFRKRFPAKKKYGSSGVCDLFPANS